MNRIIELNKDTIKELAIIDFESDHQMESSLSLADYERMLTERFDEGSEVFFGYEQDGELVGYVTFIPRFPGHKHCEVYWLAVKKKCQGKGIGSKLMMFIEEYAKKKGFRKVCLYTNKEMMLTRRFYEKIGYELVNDFPDYYGYSEGCTTAVLYAKTL